MKKRTKKLTIFSVLLPLFFLVVVFYLGSSVKEMARVSSDKKVVIQQNNEKISSMEYEIENFQEEISKSGSTEYVEKVAREELGMVKPREIIFIDKNKKSEKSH